MTRDQAWWASPSKLPKFPKALPVSRRCHPTCVGVMLNVETGLIEKCDDCARFTDDLEAAAFVLVRMHAHGATKALGRAAVLTLIDLS